MSDSAEAFVFLAGEGRDVAFSADITKMQIDKDYVIAPDPANPMDPDGWSVVIMHKDYKDVVIKYHNVQMNPEKQEIEFQVELMMIPEGSLVDPAEERFCRVCSLIIQDLIDEMNRADSLVITDEKGKEIVQDEESKFNVH